MSYVHLFFILSIIISSSVFFYIAENVASANNKNNEKSQLTNPPYTEVAETEVLLDVIPTKTETPATETELVTNETKPKPKPETKIEAITPKITKITKESKNSGSNQVEVPFYSQFADITSPSQKKIGCGVASLAMLIELYNPGEKVSVDNLFENGLNAGAYLNNAGWIHAGLINLSKEYGLDGQSHSLADRSANSAFEKLKTVLDDGPVMASVHYTFEPTNPIPHLVVINSVSSDGNTVYYNDPAEKSGNNSISKDKFIKAWKKRYIEIRPT